MPAPHRPTPRWHPIASLPLIAPVIDGQLEGAEEQHRLLLQAKPGSLDDATVERVVQVFTEDVEFLVIYQEQLDRWRAEPLTIEQRREVDRLGRQVARNRDVAADIHTLAGELKANTIDAILAKSDLELGLELPSTRSALSRRGGLFDRNRRESGLWSGAYNLLSQTRGGGRRSSRSGRGGRVPKR